MVQHLAAPAQSGERTRVNAFAHCRAAHQDEIGRGLPTALDAFEITVRAVRHPAVALGYHREVERQ